MRLIGQAHTMLHERGIVRIQTDIRVGSRYEFFFFSIVSLLFNVWLMVLSGPIRSSLSAKRSQPWNEYWMPARRLDECSEVLLLG